MIGIRIFGRGALLAVMATLVAAGSAGAVTIKEFPVEIGSPPGAHAPRYIHPGPDGNLWFTDGGTSAGIGRIATDGSQFDEILNVGKPVDLVFTPDGTAFWTSDDNFLWSRLPSGQLRVQGISGAGYAAALTSSGDLRWTDRRTLGLDVGEACKFVGGIQNVACTLIGASTRVTGLTLGSDGHLWAAAYEENRLHRLADDGVTPDLSLDLPSNSGPARLALGPDGNLWVTMYGASAIDRVTPAGIRTRFPLPAGRGPNDITLGPDGALWFTELTANKIGRMTTSGALTEFDIPTADSQPSGLTTGPDGAIWFTESKAGQVGRLQPDSHGAGGGGGGTGGGGGGGGGAGGGGTGGGGSGRVVARHEALSPATFAAAPSGPSALAARRHYGTIVTLTLNETATVRFTVLAPQTGRRARSGHCAKPTRSNRHGRRCTRLVPLRGSFTRVGTAGSNRFRFTGRLAGHALKPGSYRLLATPAVGKHVGRSTSAGFRIIR